MKTFKVGDRVRVKQECVGCNCRGDGIDGGYGIITEKRGKRWFGVKLDNEKVKYEPSYREDELILLEDAMEYTVNGVTYRQLRDITLLKLINARIPADELDRLVQNIITKYGIVSLAWAIPFDWAIGYASSCNEKLQWLVDQGFTEKVEDEQAIHERIYYDPETNRFFRTELFGKFGHDCEFYNDAHKTIGTQEGSGRKLWRSIPIKSIEDLKKYAELYKDYGFKVKNMK